MYNLLPNFTKKKYLAPKSRKLLLAAITCFLLNGQLLALDSTSVPVIASSLTPAMSYVLDAGYSTRYILTEGTPTMIDATSVNRLCPTTAGWTAVVEVIPNNQDWFSSKSNLPNAYHVVSPYLITVGNNYWIYTNWADVDMSNAGDSGWVGLGWTVYCRHS